MRPGIGPSYIRRVLSRSCRGLSALSVCVKAVLSGGQARAMTLLHLREDEREQIRPHRGEPAAAVERLGAIVPALDHDLQPARPGRDRVALRPLEQRPADALVLVHGMDAELLDAKDPVVFLDRDVPSRLAGQLGHEDGIAHQRRQRAAVVGLGEGELRDTEQRPLVLGSEGPHRDLAVRHFGGDASALKLEASPGPGDVRPTAKGRSATMGHAISALDEIGDGYGFRKVRRALGVTAFGVNAVVMPPGYEGFVHYHDTQDELYFVHSGTARFAV